MNYYLFDATALVYAYVPGIDGVRDFVCSGHPDCRLMVCDLSQLEAAVALIDGAKKWKLTRNQLSSAFNRLRADSRPGTSPFVIIESSGVMGDAPDLLQMHALSASAAAVFSAALVARASLPPESEICVVTIDDVLSNALGTEGIRAIRPYQLTDPTINV